MKYGLDVYGEKLSTPTRSFSLRHVFKGASAYSLGQVLVQASGFFLVPVYTRLLTPADYGIVGYLQVFLQLATVILSFGFASAQTRFLYEKSHGKTAIGRFLCSINMVPVAFAVFVGLPLSIVGTFADWTVGKAAIPFTPYVTLILWTVVLNVIADNAVLFFQAQQRFVVTTVLQVARFLCVTAFTLLFVIRFELGALGRIAGVFAGMLLFATVCCVPYTRSFVWRPSRKALAYAAAFGAPIVVHSMSAVLHNAIDRVILERYVDLSALGIYTLGFTIGSTLGVFIAAFNRAFQPSYFELMSSDRTDKEKQLVRTFKAWLFIVTSMAVLWIWLGKPFLRVFAGPRFFATTVVFPWIILAVFIGGFYYFFSSPIFYFKRTKLLPVITGSSAVVNILFNLLLIPRYGIVGAAMATAISHLVESSAALIIGNRLYRVNWPYGWVVGSTAVVATSAVAAIHLG